MSALLRTKFTNHMTLRGFSPKTKEAYIGTVARLAGYFHQSPDRLSNDSGIPASSDKRAQTGLEFRKRGLFRASVFL